MNEPIVVSEATAISELETTRSFETFYEGEPSVAPVASPSLTEEAPASPTEAFPDISGSQFPTP